MLDKILNFIADMLSDISYKLGKDEYKTEDIGWTGTSFTPNKTGIMTISVTPVQSGVSKLVVTDTTDNIEVIAKMNSGTSFPLIGQCVAVKGHTYSLKVENVSSNRTYKITTPTGWERFCKTQNFKAFRRSFCKGGVFEC